MIILFERERETKRDRERKHEPLLIFGVFQPTNYLICARLSFLQFGLGWIGFSNELGFNVLKTFSVLSL